MAIHGKLAHVRQLGQGHPGWNNPVWQMAGADPSMSAYDVPDPGDQSNLNYSVGGNVTTRRTQNNPTNPSITRDSRASFFSSVPAARFFQGAFATSFSWLYPLNPTLPHTPLNMNYNPGQAGTKELFPATVYNPYPASSEFYPKAL